ncbi:MAG: phenylalanine--tRNA ligase subunit alpha [Bacteroidota bacterium]
MLQKQITTLEKEIANYHINSLEELAIFKQKYIGKKNEAFTLLFEQLKKMPAEEKKHFGKLLNSIKNIAQEKYNQYEKQHNKQSLSANSAPEDLTLPPAYSQPGTIHPLNQITQKIIHLFRRIGFSLADGPEIESDWNNFSALNFPQDHPAREMQDTFFIARPTKEKSLLRTHTSSVQVRTMQHNNPPIKILSTGKVFRKEAISARTHCMFHQLEGLYINDEVSFIDLKNTIFYFVENFFGPKIKIRFRPSYFPFTEPSAEVDISCLLCKSKGCAVCKHTGWVEIAGAGMIDPNVLTNCKIDPEKYTGFAFGMGIERIAMLYYQIPDIRLFTQNDIRFLRQFAAKI